MFNLLKKVLWLALLLSLTACAGGGGIKEDFDKSVKTFNRMLRWHEMENAVTVYADDENREEALKKAGYLLQKGLTITDFRIVSTRYIREGSTGDVITEFDYHIMPSNRVKTLSHRQQWVYNSSTGSWHLKNVLPLFE